MGQLLFMYVSGVLDDDIREDPFPARWCGMFA